MSDEKDWDGEKRAAAGLCDACGESGVIHYGTEGDGDYWLCGALDDDHSTEKYGGWVIGYKLPDAPTPDIQISWSPPCSDGCHWPKDPEHRVDCPRRYLPLVKEVRGILAVLRNAVHKHSATNACDGSETCWCDDCKEERRMRQQGDVDAWALPATKAAGGVSQ